MNKNTFSPVLWCQSIFDVQVCCVVVHSQQSGTCQALYPAHQAGEADNDGERLQASKVKVNKEKSSHWPACWLLAELISAWVCWVCLYRLLSRFGFAVCCCEAPVRPDAGSNLPRTRFMVTGRYLVGVPVDSLRLTPSCSLLFTVYFVVNSTTGQQSFWTTRHLFLSGARRGAFKSNKAAQPLRTL